MAVFGRTAPVRARRKSREVLIVAARGWQLLGLGAILALGGGAAQAENLDAGKPAPALFAATCAACHSSPRGLAKDRGSGSLASFLQEHYTSGPQSAASLAA
jgi:mono/diheme cytochrome c family protein